MIAVGDTLGRYDLLARLRAGGMATLYLGKRVGVAGFTRPVAIKVIHPHLAASPRFVQMFVDEATLSAKIDDPHVVHVEELGEANGTYFLVMEYVDGASLAELLRELGRRKRALSVELAVWVAAQVAAGLHAAHEATTETGEPLGIVHRDVSPHNVLLAFKGHVKLIDFGVAKARGRPGDTQTGSLRGKLAYMPPEQAFGRSVDRRADVYALGVVLWEMLTMRRLFDADNEFALLERVRHPDICPPGQVAAGIPPALEQVVMAALAPDPERRPATAEELRARLMAAVPEASSKTAHDLSGVIAAIMPDTIKRARERLAEALGEPLARSEAPAAPLAPDDEALATMTVTMPDATILFEREHEVEAPHAEATARRARPRRAAPPMLVLGAAGAALAIVVAMAVVIATRR
ncbi:MAG: serine/threonine protein kinase, partial [Labilithrix sp.]|nr:serine/threonine protein kinase [Labilithrix sp.]